jgi:hypothetical protein
VNLLSGDASDLPPSRTPSVRDRALLGAYLAESLGDSDAHLSLALTVTALTWMSESSGQLSHADADAFVGARVWL